MAECYTMSCYDCIHCDRCSDFESGFSAHCADVSKCKHFRNKADFVEVVRCKDCKFYQKQYHNCELHSELPDQFFTGFIFEMEEDGFCSCGERKEE